METALCPPAQDGGTALYGAVNDLQLEMVELLLAAGASPNISGRIPGPDGSVVDGWTALHAAVSHGNAEMVELLVDRGANLDATTSTTSPGGESISEGMTAMCAAAQRGMADIVKARAARRLSALLLVRHLPDSCPAVTVAWLCGGPSTCECLLSLLLAFTDSRPGGR